MEKSKEDIIIEALEIWVINVRSHLAYMHPTSEKEAAKLDIKLAEGLIREFNKKKMKSKEQDTIRKVLEDVHAHRTGLQLAETRLMAIHIREVLGDDSFDMPDPTVTPTK